MLWSEFFPYVIPYVLGCPYPMAEQHVRLSAIEFCRRTACHQQTLDAETTDGTTHSVDLSPDAGTVVNKVRSVWVDGRSFPVVEAKRGISLESSNSEYCFTQDNKTLQIYPLQIAGIPVVVEVVLVPSITSSSINSLIGGDYLQDIAAGAIASLSRVPTFDDPRTAAFFQSQYIARMATVAAKVARGFAASKMQAHTSFV